MGSCGEANASTAVCTSCCAGVENLCLDNIDGSFLGVLFECFLLIYSFVAVAIIADEHLVCSLETLCVRWNVREDVAGASFMAFGSAAPEIIINAISTLKTVLASGREGGGEAGEDTSLGIGAIIGSGMIAFSFIPGCCGLSATRPLELKRRPLGRDILAYSLALILLFLAISDGKVEAGESAVMLCVYVAYLLIVIFASSIREKYRVGVLGRAARSKSSFVVQAQESLFPGAQQEQGMTPAGLGGGSGGSGGSGGGGGGGGCSDALGDQLSPTGLQPLSLCGTPGPASGASASEDIQMRTPVFDGPSSSSASGAVQTTPTQTPSSAPNCFDITISSTSFASPAGSHPATLPSALRQLLPPIATAGLERLMRLGGLAGRATLAPLMLALRVTCPECAHDSPGARLYPLTLASSFVWVAFFSTLISAVVSRGGELLCIPSIFLGMYIIVRPTTASRAHPLSILAPLPLHARPSPFLVLRSSRHKPLDTPRPAPSLHLTTHLRTCCSCYPGTGCRDT